MKANTSMLLGRLTACTTVACWLWALDSSGWPLLIAASAATRAQQDAISLVPGQTLEREWDGQQPHLYRLRLEAGQYVSLSLNVLDGKARLWLTLFTPDGARIEGVNDKVQDSRQDAPALVAIVPNAGDYTLQVSVPPRSLETASSRGRYALSIAALRAPTERDRLTAEVWITLRQASFAHGADTSDSITRSKELCRKAIALFHQLGLAYWETHTLFMLADVHNSLGEYEQAVEASQRAFALARAAGSTHNEANALMYLGEAHLHLANYAEALGAFEQALPVWRALGKKSSWGLGWALHSIGSCLNLLGERRKAAEHYKQALEIYQAVDYSLREHYRGTGASASNLGRMHLLLGEMQQAAEYLSLGLEYWHKAKEPWGEARAYYFFGDLYLALGDLPLALDNYQQALDKWRISNDPPYVANALDSLGKISLKTGAYAPAARYLNESLELRVKSKDRRGQAETLALLGRLLAATGEPRKALDHQRQSLALWREIGARGGEAATLSDLGETCYVLGDKQLARELLQQALQLQRAVQAPAGEAQALYSLARLKRDLGMATEARHDIEAALGIIESLRASVVSQELRASYLASVRDYYEFYLDLLMQSSRSDEETRLALNISERARARSLLESLSEIRADIRQGVDAALLARERELQQLLNGKSEYQMRLLGGKHTPEQAAAVAAEIKTIVSQLQETRARIRAVSPRYTALTQPRPMTAEQIQRELLDEDTLLLEYALGEERSYVWAVTPASLTSYELPRRAEIETQAARVYELLTARNRRIVGESPRQEQQRIARADADLPPQAAALSRMILGPVAARLGKKRLLVVAQGKLQFIPFGALPEPEVKQEWQPSAIRNPQSAIPLIVNHEIVYLPSASTLAALRQEVAGRRPASKTIALLADPVFEMDDERLKKPRSAARTSAASPARRSRELLRAVEVFNETGELLQFHRLTATEWEAKQTAQRVPASQVMLALGFAANRATAISGALSDYRIVHFASHSFLHSAHPELSGIVLSLLDEQGREQDGFLRLHEIYNLKLPADLVVLSACQTGLGKEVKGEGLMSLTRGFMYAGAPRVVVSAWSIEDRASATLMVKFYKHLLGPRRLSAAAALRAAQLEMWRDREFAAPYFWGGFVLQGEWR